MSVTRDVWKQETADAANHLRGAFRPVAREESKTDLEAPALSANGLTVLRAKHRMEMGGGQMTRAS